MPHEEKKPSSSTSPVTLHPATDKMGPRATDSTTSFDQGEESEAVSEDTQVPTVLAGPSTSGEEVINILSPSTSVIMSTIQESEEPTPDNSPAFCTASSSVRTSTNSCKGCKHKEYQRAMHAKKRLKNKVKSLQKELSALKNTITELQSLCFTKFETIFHHFQ